MATGISNDLDDEFALLEEKLLHKLEACVEQCSRCIKKNVNLVLLQIEAALSRIELKIADSLQSQRTDLIKRLRNQFEYDLQHGSKQLEFRQSHVSIGKLADCLSGAVFYENAFTLGNKIKYLEYLDSCDEIDLNTQVDLEADLKVVG